MVLLCITMIHYIAYKNDIIFYIPFMGAMFCVVHTGNSVKLTKYQLSQINNLKEASQIFDLDMFPQWNK